VIVVGLGTAIATSGLFPDSWSNTAPALASALIGIAVIAGLVSLVFGVSLRDLVPTIERRLQGLIEDRLRNWFAAAPVDRSTGTER
jgi:hypothetical protein